MAQMEFRSTAGSSRINAGFSVTRRSKILTAKSLFDQFRFQCRQCRDPLAWSDDIWEEHIESWLTRAKTIPPKSQISALQCTTCKTITCVGCGGEPKIDKHNYWTSLGVVNHCCSRGRLFGISLILYRFDRESEILQKVVKVKATSKPRIPRSTKKQVDHTAPFAPPGVGYAADSDYTFDPYGEDPYLDEGDMDILYGAIGKQLASLLPEPAEKDIMDPLLTNTLRILLGFLESPVTPQPTDVGTTISASRFLDQIIDLARNNSIEDMAQRQDLYLAMFDFMRQIIKEGSGVASLAFQTRGEGASWYMSCKDTFVQANLFLQLTSKSDEARNKISKRPFASRMSFLARTNALEKDLESAPNKSKSHSDSVTICKTFLDLYNAMTRHPANSTIPVPPNTPEPEYNWANFSKTNKLTFSDDIATNHRLYQPGTHVINTPARNRSTVINKEIANMLTSLPDGIFVKVDESRSDVMKALIVGIEGTPYAGGLFTFDILLDQNYPISPPKMLFVLEGVDEDNTAVNPNLHVGGQVCLSLLNTWDGTLAEMWQPNKSTILAVLVSIQAMILGAAVPYMNEPGMARVDESRPEVKDYTFGAQCKTVKYAMIQWLKKLENMNPSSTDKVWKDVSATYWKYNSENVLQTVRQWAIENPRLRNYVGDDNTHNPFATAHAPLIKRPGKGKKKAVDGDDLLCTLTKLISPDTASESLANDDTLQVSIPVRKRGSESLEDESESTTGKRPKYSKSKSEPNDVNDFVLPLAAKVKAAVKAAKSTPKGDGIAMRWYYTGPKKMIDIRKACDEFGLKPATSIQRSIERLETEFNDENESEYAHVTEFGNKWGEFREVA